VKKTTTYRSFLCSSTFPEVVLKFYDAVVATPELDRAICLWRVFYSLVVVIALVRTVFVAYDPKPNSPLQVLCYLLGKRLCQYPEDIRNYQSSQDEVKELSE
jgi:hypothetical protein